MSRATQALASVVLGFLGLKLVTLATNLAAFPTLRARPGHPPESAALLIPMRDEARQLPATLPGFRAAGVAVTVLDDGSRDGSAGLVDAAGVRVVTGSPRPPGWTGKTWACAQLADLTDADVLVFCDADVLLAPGAIGAVLAEMDRQRADVFSVFSRQLTGTWAERLLIPLVDDVLLCFLPFSLLSVPAAASAATASGALLAFRREAYEKLGGFAAFRGELVEDVAIARRTRRLGLRLGLALGGDVVRVRMYRSFGEIVEGFGRGLVPAAGGRRAAVVAGLVWHVVAYSGALLGATTSPRWRLVALMGMLERALVEAKTGGRDWSAAALIGVSPLAAVPVVARSLRRRQSWKGRMYG